MEPSFMSSETGLQEYRSERECHSFFAVRSFHIEKSSQKK